MTYQTIPVKGYRIICSTDEDMSLYGLPPDFEKAKASLIEYRKDYPRDEFKLVAIVDA